MDYVVEIERSIRECGEIEREREEREIDGERVED